MKIRSTLPTIFLAVFAAFFWGMNHAAAQPYRWYVNASSTATPFGFDWQNPFTDLQQALDFANAGDEIWVAAGTYKPTDGADRDKSFYLKSGVKFYGSFAGTENTPAERPISANPTILSGDIGQPGDSTDNSRTIMYLDHPDSATLISGFVFEGGQATSDTFSSSENRSICGAGIYMYVSFGSAALVLEDCIFRNNYAKRDGGAFYTNRKSVQRSLPSFKRCSFINNRAGLSGAAVVIRGGNEQDHETEFESCVFTGNMAISGNGGAIEFIKEYGSESIDIHNCQFYQNKSNGSGAVFVWSLPSFFSTYVQIKNCSFEENVSKFGDMIACNGTGGVFNNQNVCDVKIDESSFLKNQFPNGSLINQDAGYVKSTLTLLNDTFSSNKFYLPLIRGELDSLCIQNSGFVKNKAITIFDPNYPSYESPLFTGNYRSKIEGNTFIENEAPLFGLQNSICRNNLIIGNLSKYSPTLSLGKGGLFSNNLVSDNYCKNSISYYSNTTIGKGQISNNIFLRNKDIDGESIFPISLFIDSVETIDYNLIDFDLSSKLPIGFIGSHNIQTTDPQFLAPDSLDFHVLPCSPAINAGTNLPWQNDPNPTDFDGNPRITDGLVDIGPFETGLLGAPFIEKIRAACDSLLGGNVGFLMDGGCPPFQFFWKKGTATGTDTAHLAPGIYQFTLTDSRGKTATATVDILGSDIAAAIAGDPVFCADEPGVLLEATIAGGQNPIVFEWNTGETGLFLQNAGDGLFVFTATDAAGCTGLDSFLVEKSPETIGQFTVNNATGPTVADGSIILNLISGQPPFLFAWSNGDSTGNPQKLAPGPYSITITNADGCTVSYDFVVGFTIKTDGAAAGGGPGFYPNPASSRLFVEWGGMDFLEIFDQKGGLVLSKKRSAGAENFGLEGLADGAYRAVFSKNGAESAVKALMIHR